MAPALPVGEIEARSPVNPVIGAIKGRAISGRRCVKAVIFESRPAPPTKHSYFATRATSESTCDRNRFRTGDLFALL